MKITRGVSHTINIGPYESLVLKAEVTIDTEVDFPDGDIEDTELITYMRSFLDEALAAELAAAGGCGSINPDSHIYEYNPRS